MIFIKYRTIFYILFTYLLTLIGGTLFFSQQISETLPNWLLIVLRIIFIPAIIAPFFIAMLMRYVENRWEGVKDLFGLFVNKNARLYWYVLVMVIPLLVHLTASLIDTLRGEPFQVPFGNADHNTIYIGIQTFLLAGIGEEMGWRGYLQPVLQQKYGFALISILIGIVVAVWHLPLFFQEIDIHSNFSFPQFLLLMLAVAFVYTWLMDNTRSILILALFHTSHDVASMNFSQVDHLSAALVYGLIAIVIIIMYGPEAFKRKPYQIVKNK